MRRIILLSRGVLRNHRKLSENCKHLQKSWSAIRANLTLFFSKDFGPDFRFSGLTGYGSFKHCIGQFMIITVMNGYGERQF